MREWWLIELSLTASGWALLPAPATVISSAVLLCSAGGSSLVSC